MLFEKRLTTCNLKNESPFIVLVVLKPWLSKLNVCNGGLNSIKDYFFVTKILIDKLKFYTHM